MTLKIGQLQTTAMAVKIENVIWAFWHKSHANRTHGCILTQIAHMDAIPQHSKECNMAFRCKSHARMRSDANRTHGCILMQIGRMDAIPQHSRECTMSF